MDSVRCGFFGGAQQLPAAGLSIALFGTVPRQSSKFHRARAARSTIATARG